MSSGTRAALAVAAVAAGLGIGVAAGRHERVATGERFPSQPKTACGRAVMEDWWDNGRVDRLYPLHCYRDALASLPRDLRLYTNVQTAIHRTLPEGAGGRLDSVSLHVGETVVLRPSQLSAGARIWCSNGGVRARATVPPPGRGMAVFADGVDESASLDVTTRDDGTLVARCTA
jgi:hypothetical protein